MFFLDIIHILTRPFASTRSGSDGLPILFQIQLGLGCLVLIGLIGYLDLITHSELSIYVFYSAPIFIAAWYGGPGLGVVSALAGAGMWFFVEGMEGGGVMMREGFYVNFALRVPFFVCMALILSSLREAFLHEEKLSRHDPLTGLYNLRGWKELAERERVRAERNKSPLALAYIDVDNFKGVNDTMGHDKGNELLVKIAEIIDESRRTDLVGRVGGDEFVLLMPDTDSSDAHQVFRRIFDDLTRFVELGKWPVTFSMGAVVFPRPPVSVREMVDRADKTMYDVKNSTKNRLIFRVYSEDSDGEQPLEEIS